MGLCAGLNGTVRREKPYPSLTFCRQNANLQIVDANKAGQAYLQEGGIGEEANGKLRVAWTGLDRPRLGSWGLLV